MLKLIMVLCSSAFSQHHCHNAVGVTLFILSLMLCNAAALVSGDDYAAINQHYAIINITYHGAEAPVSEASSLIGQNSFVFLEALLNLISAGVVLPCKKLFIKWHPRNRLRRHIFSSFFIVFFMWEDSLTLNVDVLDCLLTQCIEN
jgi:hypothetical protein